MMRKSVSWMKGSGSFLSLECLLSSSLPGSVSPRTRPSLDQRRRHLRDGPLKKPPTTSYQCHDLELWSHECNAIFHGSLAWFTNGSSNQHLYGSSRSTHRFCHLNYRKFYWFCICTDLVGAALG
ncbi:hypothetical protein FOMG_19875 [Fusarium oxysporum f. sp. melonis 26406]|nr:hypothetical protein FOMG_19875 [Fusarium oxysporum f. sp. melonis 26406]